MKELAVGLIFISSLVGVRRHSHDILNPLFWTNVAFLLYGISFVYLYVFGVDGAVFLSLAGLDEVDDAFFLMSAAAVLIGKISFEAPRAFFQPTEVNADARVYMMSDGWLRMLRGLAFIFVLAGLSYWVYVMLVVTGGSFQIFANMGIWEYVIKDSGLSILPYQLAFVGCQIWFLSYFVKPNQFRWRAFLLYPAVALMTITTGRLSASLMQILVPIFFLSFATRGELPLKKVFLPLMIGAGAIVVLYFYRSYTSYAYIGKPEEFLESLLSGDVQASFLGQMVGGGNISDPQQLILLFDALNQEKLHFLYGATYFDWIGNFIYRDAPSSVGYRIHAIYFPEKSGGPTPGAIGEAILNFGPLFFIPLLLLGSIASVFHRSAKASTSLLFKYVYTKFLLHFWVLFIKVDSTLLGNLFWEVVPISLAWGFLVKLPEAVFSSEDDRRF